MKGMSGQRISSYPPYGYIKGEGGQLVPDPEAAWVVKLMFDLAAQGLRSEEHTSELQSR